MAVQRHGDGTRYVGTAVGSVVDVKHGVELCELVVVGDVRFEQRKCARMNESGEKPIK